MAYSVNTNDNRRLAALEEADRRGLLGKVQKAALDTIRQRVSQATGIVEPAMAVGTGALAHLAGVATGAGGLAVGSSVGGFPLGVDVAENAYSRVSDAMTYRPRTESGQATMQQLGGIMQNVGDRFNTALGQGAGAVMSAIPGQTAYKAPAVQEAITTKGPTQAFSDYVAQTTGSPTAGTVASWIPGAAELAFGAKGIGRLSGLEMGDIGGQGMGNQRGAVGGVKQSVSSGSFLDQNWQERMLTKEKYDELGLSDSTFGTTRADLTAADPDGIKSLGGATFDTPVPAQGGPGYSDMFGLGWAAREMGGTGKLIKDEFLVPTAMTKDSHKSNATVSTAYTTALQKNIDNGWVSKDTIKSIESDLSAKFPDVPTGGTPKEFNDWLDSVTFEKRSGVMSILGKSKFEGKGLPDVNRLLSQTLDKGASGTYPTEAMTLIKNDPDSGVVKLDGKGYPSHLSYKYGTKGEVKAIFPPGMNEADLHPGDWSQYVEKSTKNGRPNPHADAVYTFQRGWYGSKFGESIRDLLPSAADIKGGRQVNSRSFDAAVSTLSDDWTALQQGSSLAGIRDFTRAMDTNDGGATLSQISETDVKKLIKSGKAKIFQLGTGKKAQEIRFMIKKGNHKWADKDAPDEEWILSSVINNESGVRGIASEAILHKAMQEGVTALDAFDVPGAYGLPKIYGKYGFIEAKRVPFKKELFLDDAKKFYISQNVGKNKKLTPKIKKEADIAADQRFADAENFWRSQGWDESKGYPDAVIMRKELDQNGNDAIKSAYANALKRTGTNGSGGVTGRGPEGALTQQREFTNGVLGGPESAQGAGQQGVPGSGSGADSVLPSGRRSSVIDTVTSGMKYPTLQRRMLPGIGQ